MRRGLEAERIVELGDGEPDPSGRYVLYWMQAAQRAEHNPALEFAVRRANDAGVPLVVAAVVVPDYPEASARHFAFLLGGMGRALRAVERRGARPCLRVGEPTRVIAELAADAVEVVLDRGYLRHQVSWYRTIEEDVDVRITQVEGEVVVPIDLVSDRAEHAARTIRPKILAERDRFLVDLDTEALDVRTTPTGTTSDVDLDRLSDDRVGSLLDDLGLAGGPRPVDGFTPGTAAARRALGDLLDRVGSYGEDRNRYGSESGGSNLSPYLHFGQISPVAVATAVMEEGGSGADDFLEELVVRRELAINFVARNDEYDTYAGAVPGWARDSLAQHRDDPREQVYTAAELEAGETDDEVWNAIMHTIRGRGWVHNQLRMYWGKQIVRWTNTPEFAYRTLLELNNRWFLDGRDPNSFSNVAWCFGLHDQGFQERSASGKLRPFTTAALRRKDDLDGWLTSAPDG